LTWVRDASDALQKPTKQLFDLQVPARPAAGEKGYDRRLACWVIRGLPLAALGLRAEAPEIGR
jgi:hypothetical protein